MTQQESPAGILGPLSFLRKPELLEERNLDWDERPIEVYLAHEGWLSADLVRWDIRTVRKARGRKVAVVDIEGVVDLGPKTIWSGPPRLEWVGEPLLPDPWLTKLIAVREGRRTQLDEVEAAEEDVRNALFDRGYARAEVTARIERGGTLDEPTAALVLTIDPGLQHTIGEIRVTGASNVRDPDLLVERSELREGALWSRDDVLRATGQLYGTGAFRQVDVEPATGPAAPGDNALDAVIAVEPGLPRRVEIGGGLGFEGPFFIPRLHTALSFDNLRQRLDPLTISADLGAGISTDGAIIPLATLEARSRFGHLFGARSLSWVSQLRTGQDLFEHVLPRQQAMLSTGVEWHPADQWTGTLTASGGVTGLLDQSLDDSSADRLTEMALGVGTPNPYLTGAVNAEMVWAPLVRRDFRRHGVRVAVEARSAWVSARNAPIGRVGVDLQGFLAPHTPALGRPFQLSARVRARQIVAGPEPIVWPERLFLGGSGSLRSFRSTGVGPYDAICADRAVYGLRQVYLARGGRRSAFAWLEGELHRVGVRELAIATFIEAGALDSRGRVGAGVGARYETPLGPFRVDLGFRPLYPEDAGPPFGAAESPDGTYRGCPELRRRPFDLISEFGRRQPFDRTFPSVNLLFSLGFQ
jgi:hypothetical protein